MGVTTQTFEEAHRTTYAMCAVAMALSVVPYLTLTRKVEVQESYVGELPVGRLDPRSRRVITRIALLFASTASAPGF